MLLGYCNYILFLYFFAGLKDLVNALHANTFRYSRQVANISFNISGPRLNGETLIETHNHS